ncbi:MAG: transketolase [Planctomycetota bacterium]
MTAARVDLATLEQYSREIRGTVVQMSHASGAPHLGSNLSCIDILVAAYWDAVRIDPSQPSDPGRDRFILSKGHAAAALYATLALRGFFPIEQLRRFNEVGYHLPEQPAPDCVPGVELATGSLGHGLGVAAGIALAAKIQRKDYHTFCLLSDGECNEGSVWEAAMFAPAQHLGQLTAIIDYNGWQATGRSDEVLALAPLTDKWSAFGWDTREVDGHDLAALQDAIRTDDARQTPRAIIAHTVKGKGVSFMEDDNNWHYRIPTADEVAAARRELQL